MAVGMREFVWARMTPSICECTSLMCAQRLREGDSCFSMENEVCPRITDQSNPSYSNQQTSLMCSIEPTP